MNRLPQGVAGGTVLGGVALVAAVWYWFSPEYTDVGYRPEQPVRFSHRTHAGTLGMDCRFCHNTVERSAFAAIPPTETCMTCHQHVLKREDTTALVRASFETGRSLRWVRVHMLPDYAFFSHRVHLAVGVGCQSCHGRIDRMAVVHQAQSLSMGWCLRCHRDPRPNLRPRSEVTNMRWDGEPGPDPALGRKIVPPTHCSGCHR
jgi:hypothetical protein